MWFVWYRSKHLIFFNTQNREHNFYQAWVRFHTTVVLTQLISNHQKGPFQCLIQLHTGFQLVPVSGLPCRQVNRLFMGIIVYNHKDLSWIITKFGAYILFWLPYKCMHFRVRAVFVVQRRLIRRKKNEEKNWNFGHLYLRNGWYNLLRIWSVAFRYGQALPQQIWCSSDKRSQIYKCVKMATLLFLLIYSLLFVRA